MEINYAGIHTKKEKFKKNTPLENLVISTMYKNLYIVRKKTKANPLNHKELAFIQLPLRTIM